VFADFEKLGAVILGVSLDDAESHKRFAEKNQIPYPLLVDTDGALAAKFGVDTSRGYTARITFLIGPDGIIRRVYPKVQIEGHSAELLEAIRAL